MCSSRSGRNYEIATLLLVCGLLLPCLARAMETGVGHPTFLSPHASPIAVSNGLVYVVNTPADTLDVLDAAGLNVIARINVGIDPVGIAVRPDGKEVWVSNHVSDSVSVVDSDPGSITYHNVIATIQDFDPVTEATRFDEPVGIAFASDDKAYVALSSQNQIAVVDVSSRQVTQSLGITAQDPRAIIVRENRLFVIPFESNNQTQISGCVGNLDGDLCTFDAVEHVIDNNNVLSRFAVVDIVRNLQIPDRDLFIFDTATDELIEIGQGLGTLLYGITVDSTGRVYVAQAEARNDANGRAGTLGDGLGEMENRAFLNQLTRVDCSSSPCATPLAMDLEPVPPSNPAQGMALATPYAIAISVDDATLVMSAASSNQLFTVEAASGEVLGRVEVGKVPRGIALESDEQGQPAQAWVFNAASNSVSRVDLTDPASPRVIGSIALEDPTHPLVKSGRIAFNDAGASTSGTYSCESCHPDGGTDQLAWILDTPICDIAGCTQIPPRVTMPVRGLRDTAPYHWDGIPGDPYGGNNTANIRGSSPPNCARDKPESCTRDLVDGSLASTMCDAMTCPLNDEGKEGALTSEERDAMSRFLLAIPYPPAPKRSYSNELSSLAKKGFSLFHIEGDLQGDPEPNVCGDCHRMPFWVSTNTPGTGMEAPTWRGASDRWLLLPQGRLNIIDFDFYRNIADNGTPEREMWRLSWAGRSRFDPVWNMVVEGSTGFSGAFARQVTLNEASSASDQTTQLLDALEQSAAGGGIVLQGEGVFLEGATATPVALQFDHWAMGGSYVDREDEPRIFSRTELIALAAQGKFIGTITGRLGQTVGLDNPQPGIWSVGPIEEQRGRQVFPTVFGDDPTLSISGRHIQEGANLFVDGKRVPGYASCKSGELPDCDDEIIEVHLSSVPLPGDMHFLQIQNHDGLFSNDYIINTFDEGTDNCPDIANPDQNDADGDGVGDRCDDDAFDFEIDPGISGTWYDPDHDGEGWFVELLDNNQALVYWFTYTPPAIGADQAQAWIGGIGEVKESSIVVSSANSWITSGPPFGPDFDPDKVRLDPWGKFVLSFSGCDGGLMYYRSNDPDYGSGSLDLIRLTEIETVTCGQSIEKTTQLEDGFTVSPAISGAWYDPAHEGEGWLLEILPNDQALVAWFSYDPAGKQAWFLNSGQVEGDSVSFELTMPSGTDFGPTFKADEISRPAWGKVTFSFESCTSGSMTYDSSLEEYGSGSLQLLRLTSLSGLECE